MRRFTDAIARSLETRNWYGALALSLTLPDVCGRLAQPNTGSRARYIAWFEQWVGPSYVHFVGVPRRRIAFLSGGDCYALRCSFLHEGGGEIEHQHARQALDRFHFITPPPLGVVHGNLVGATLQLQVDVFCRDIVSGVDRWADAVADDAAIQARIANLLIIHNASA